ncbi:hypothetical protein BDV24DRAFT_132699 [Aspergillus arachidicola]|uniref:Uncharacterized protein n=1 Tax=Aspergillus arachidicola TaxID=656916 RepID=A0A5N6Y959_9EURO|nr:hypothetical protein BDV24DRAFT_132699 [Aspergillus arachidicola]
MIFWSGLFLSFGVVEKKNYFFISFSFSFALIPHILFFRFRPRSSCRCSFGCTWLIFLVPIKLIV